VRFVTGRVNLNKKLCTKQNKDMEALAMSALTGGGTKKGTGMKMMVYPQDAKDFIKWGAIGFLGFGGYQLFMNIAKRNINPSVDFVDPVESMNCDPIIRDCFINIQPYRKLNPWLFKTALQNVDQLLFLENALLSQEVHPVRNDKVSAWTYFRMGVNRLNQFQFLVRERMGNEHGLAVNIFVKKIYEQMKKHALNVLHLCSEFKPEHLIARAPLEVDRAIRSFEEGKPLLTSEEKWKNLRGKIEKEERRNSKHRSSRKLDRSRSRRSHRHHSEPEEEKKVEVETENVEPQ